MSVLVDTSVLSELRRARPEPRVRAAVEAIPDADLFISVLTMGEIVSGIERLAPGAKRSALEAWVRGLAEMHAARILAVDLGVARLWGELTARAARQGRVVPAVDGLIAATALRHDLAVLTRSVADFAATGCRVIDPCEGPA